VRRFRAAERWLIVSVIRERPGISTERKRACFDTIRQITGT